MLVVLNTALGALPFISLLAMIWAYLSVDTPLFAAIAGASLIWSLLIVGVTNVSSAFG